MDPNATIDFIRNLGYAEKMHFVVANSNAATFAYQRLLVHHAGAAVQMRRLTDALIAAQMASLPTDSTHEQRLAYIADGLKKSTPVLFELHFYFAAWTGCGRMLRILTKQPEFLAARRIFDGYRKQFKMYEQARDSFEHFHDRLPGERDHARRMHETQQAPPSPPVTLYWSIENGLYKHSNVSCDITPASLNLLDTIVGQTLSVIHETIDQRLNAKFSRLSDHQSA